MFGRSSGFAIFLICSVVAFWQPLSGLAYLAAHDERYSYILVIPLVSACLIFMDRARIFCDTARDTVFSVASGFIVTCLALTAYISLRGKLLPDILISRLPFTVSLLLLLWIGGFSFFYGLKATEAAMFPLGFLLLTIPVPDVAVAQAVVMLQRGTASTASFLFHLTDLPVFRQGLRFSLPGIDIEIAKECSGIRSSLSLLIASILVAYRSLDSNSRRAVLIIASIPIVIFKNAVRVVVIAWLGIRVDRGFFYGNLHHYGGLVFSLLGIVILGGLLLVLRSRATTGSRGVLAVSILYVA